MQITVRMVQHWRLPLHARLQWHGVSSHDRWLPRPFPLAGQLLSEVQTVTDKFSDLAMATNHYRCDVEWISSSASQHWCISATLALVSP